MFDPDSPRIFIPESKEQEESRHRKQKLEEHLKWVKKTIKYGMVGLFFILWLFSQNGRYQPASGNGDLIVDTRNGVVFDYSGNWIGSKGQKIVNIERLEIGFWPYFGFWKVKTIEK